MRVNLGELHRDLEDIILIRGYGLTSNVYVILGREIGVVDVGSGPPTNLLSKEFREHGIGMKQISKIVLTHTHPDHIGGIKEPLSEANPTIYVHPVAFDRLQGFRRLVPLVDGETVQVGHLTLKINFTPGHSADSVCLYNPSLQILFSGDTLFPYGNIGRTDLPTGNHSQLIRSLRSLNSLSVRHLLPGHEDPVIGDGGRHVRASLRTAEEFFLESI